MIMQASKNSKYEFYIVVLTKQGRLLDFYAKASSIADALDRMIDQFDLAGNIENFKYCIRKEILLYPESPEQ